MIYLSSLKAELKLETPNENLYIENVQPPFRKDRRDRLGGGVIIYVRDTFSCKRRGDLELDNLEAVWIELSVKSKKILLGGAYRPPNSDNAYFNLLEESIDRAYNTHIVDLFLLGDFNFDLSHNASNKMTNLIQSYDLKQLIQEQTHFTENSSSLIDLIQARNTSNISSDWSSIHAGVSQGSILGPLLFLIYINDIVKDMGSEIRLFADDTSLYIVVESPNTAAGIINTDLGRISNWATNWLVRFNANKTIAMLISRKLIHVNHPPLLMNVIVITEQQSHKHLGITFSKTCTWSEHIDEIAKMGWSRLNLLRSLKFRVSRKALEKNVHFIYSSTLGILRHCVG